MLNPINITNIFVIVNIYFFVPFGYIESEVHSFELLLGHGGELIESHIIGSFWVRIMLFYQGDFVFEYLFSVGIFK